MENSVPCRTLLEEGDNSERHDSSVLKTFENTCTLHDKEPNAAIDDEKIIIQNHNNPIEMSKMCAPAESQDEKKYPVSIFVTSHQSTLEETNREDDGSVSSLDSCEEVSIQSRSKRSIFNSYWRHTIAEEGPQTKQNDTSCSQTAKTSGSSSCSFSTTRCLHEAAIPPLPDEFTYQEFDRDFSKNCSSNNNCNDYEAILKNNEVGRTAIPHSTSLKDVPVNDSRPKFITNSSSTGSFRSLFKTKYSTSSPSLSYGYLDSNASFRKTSSASSLKKKQRSCLRNRSLSVDSTAGVSLQSSSSKLSVSFDSTVFVHEYEKPHDRYTRNGWSKYFV